MMSMLWRKALADVLRRPIRSMLVIIGIMVGVFGLTAIDVSNAQVMSALNFSADQTSAANITLAVDQVSTSLHSSLAAVPNVAAVQLAQIYHTRWQIATAPGHVNINILAFPDLTHVAVDPFQLSAGRLPGTGEIAMEVSDSALQPIQIGNEITISTPNGPQSLRVVGLTRTLGNTSAAVTDVATAYVSLDEAAALSGTSALNTIFVHVRDPGQTSATITPLRQLLVNNGITINGYSWTANPFGPGPLNGIFAILRVLAAIALMLSAFLIFNTISTMLTEQIRIIGTMKAIGGQRGQIIRGYLIAVVMYGLIGTTLGSILGIFGGIAFANFIDNLIVLDLGPLALTPGILALSILCGLGVPVLAALIPLFQGTQITVREALSSYGISVGNVRRGRFSWLPATIQVGQRGLWRRRGRTLLTLAALACAGAAFLAIQTTTVSVNRTLNDIFKVYDADIFVGFQPIPQAQASAILNTIPNIKTIEPYSTDAIQTPWGLTLVRGFLPTTQIYRYQLLQGRWLAPGETGEVVVSDLFEQHAHLRIGATLTLATSTNQAIYRIVGEVHDSNGGIGVTGSVFVSYNDLELLNQAQTGDAHGFILQAQDRSPVAVNNLATELDTTLSAHGLSPSVETTQQEIQRNQQQFQILYLILYGTVAIVALVGMLGLANTLTTSVLERRREIGILRALGATGSRVAAVFLTEGVSLGIMSWLVACVIGIPGSLAFNAMINQVLLPIQFTFAPMTLGIMLAFILGVAALASLAPAIMASRTRIAETLRYE